MHDEAGSPRLRVRVGGGARWWALHVWCLSSCDGIIEALFNKLMVFGPRVKPLTEVAGLS
jgi:hypothetical protein